MRPRIWSSVVTGTGAVLTAVLLGAVGAPAAPVAPPDPGEAIYRNGVLPSGQPLHGSREGGEPLTGAQAACTNCHRRSGLGEVESTIKIPPVAGPYLFHARARRREELEVPYLDDMRIDRDPYTPETLARAIREGIGADGKPLNYLMPRYDLGDADLGKLIQYLKQLNPLQTRGVDGSVVHFATIITPDADPAKRRAMLSVLDQYFADQNSHARAQSPSRTRLPSLQSNATRRWQLHLWELTGPPAAWEAELNAHLAREPVYAVISGLGGKDWQPVHRFCERAQLPCIFPNLDLPVVAEHDVYSLYFSKGVLLEANLLARQIVADNRSKRVGRVVQIFRADDIGAAAAATLRAALEGSGIPTLERPLRATGMNGMADSLKSVRPGDALVLWLRPADFPPLTGISPPGADIFASGLMGGLESTPLPPAWRPVTGLTYPAELPDKRYVGVEFALGWMAHNRIPLLEPLVQVDTYVACGLMLETLNRMGGSFSADYLVERMEGMLEHQLISGYYPALALAPNERFASKGGYMVHFTGPSGPQVSSDGEWRVP